MSIHKIKTKLILSYSFLILAGVVLGGIFLYFFFYIEGYYVYRKEVDNLKYLTSNAQNLQKDFLSLDANSENFMRTQKSKTITAFDINKKAINEMLKELEIDPITPSLGLSENSKRSTELLAKYHTTFDVLKDKVLQRGYRDIGLEGKMRDVAHELENLKGKVREVDILTLRRHEKNFIIRKEMRFVEYLDKACEDIVQNLNDSLSKSAKTEIASAVESYRVMFKQMVAIEKEIGFTQEAGIRGQLTNIVKKINDEVEAFDMILTLHTDQIKNQAWLIIISATLIMLITASIFAVYFANSVSKPIELLDRITQSVVKGLRNQEQFLERITSDDEVGNLAKNFKVMLSKLKSSIAEAENKNIQLEDFAREEAKRSWSSTGLSTFADILRNNHENVEKQAFEIIATLVRYTESNQGGIFIVNDDDENHKFLELKGSYAYERQKFLNKTIEYGEGLVGSVWREQDTRFITDIPLNYANITSGLGQATPKSLLIIPIKNDNKVEGVLELMSFKIYQPFEIDFIESLSRRIATTIAAVKSNEKNAQLLSASKDFADKLKIKEEELKKQLHNYENWVQQFEAKLNAVADEAHVYQTIINKVYEGIILTNEKFIVTKVNNHVLKRFGYKRQELEGQSVDILIETDYANIIDLREKTFKLSYKSFTQNVTGKVIDNVGGICPVQMMSGKLEIEDRIVYVFLFNEDSSYKNIEDTSNEREPKRDDFSMFQ